VHLVHAQRLVGHAQHLVRTCLAQLFGVGVIVDTRDHAQVGVERPRAEHDEQVILIFTPCHHQPQRVQQAERVM
jgi:hypothetical protein